MQYEFLINLNPDENFLKGLKYHADEKTEYSQSKSFLCVYIVVAEIKVVSLGVIIR